ncbi:unnamed protein product [Linum trigynum]|uniref:Uncharacterized protein n=1 Tax=Linum trigynum TaxID=586398 RepID=A0AAV2CYB2_9ROSI
MPNENKSVSPPGDGAISVRHYMNAPLDNIREDPSEDEDLGKSDALVGVVVNDAPPKDVGNISSRANQDVVVDDKQRHEDPKSEQV